MIEIHSRSKPHRDRNDDIAGFHGQTYWVMDGATQLVVPEHGKDVAWHVQTLDHALKDILAQNPDLPLPDLAKRAITQTADEFYNATGLREDAEQELRPFATLVLCRIAVNTLDYLVVCDSTLAVVAPDDEHVIADRRIDDGNPMAALYSLLRGGQGFSSNAFRHEMHELYRATYARLNRPGGFDVVGQDASVIDRALTGRMTVSHSDHILMMTDGFTRALDTLGIYTSWRSLVQDLELLGGENVLDKIRAAEEADAHGAKYPRPSLHDDATLLWIKPDYGGNGAAEAD